MSDIIKLLPDHIANQIAAGEVVQRPASVVKELLENSIDAGATEIKLIIKDAGKTAIQIIDNGIGMSATDTRMAFERHATSKIDSAEDLFHIHTKGFRGEALASIAAVAHVEVKTKTASQELGTHLKIEGSKITYQEPVSTPTGTSIAVRNLFFNIPARRKFLKSDHVETRHIKEELYRIVLAHPDIKFLYYYNDSENLNLPKSNLKQRIIATFGQKMDERLVPIEENTDILKVTGFVSKPEFAKKKRGEQFFFVNNRFIRNSYLHHSVINAFEGLLASGYHPSYFLYLKVPATTIDINIHPTKTEIKFDNEQALYAILRSTIKHSLGQYNAAPVLDFNRNPDLDTPYSYKDKKNVPAPGISVDPDFNPFKENLERPSGIYKKNTANWESLYTRTSIATETEQPSDNQSTLLFPNAKDTSNYSTLQVHNKYILSVIKSGVVFINQHLAHQRILYEELLTKLTVEDTASQQLLFPITLHFSFGDMVICNEIKNDLESIGFQFAAMEKDSVTLSGLPENVIPENLQGLFESVFDNVRNEIPESNFSRIDTIAKSLAKGLAIKNGVALNELEREKVLEDLFSCKEPNYSPYGKKTYITLPSEEIQLKFDP
ncbi:MAG: DNA mismatch repair protein MutL [Flavobacteriales bacterium]|nr:MAG: DNA mismatch repair protein MutL [Flavobacteriales bacterium]